MVLNPFSLLLVRSRPARVYIWVLGWSWFPSEVFAITCAPSFPTCAIKRGLQCYTRMPFTIGMVPGRRHSKCWIRVILLHYSALTSKSCELCQKSAAANSSAHQARDRWGISLSILSVDNFYYECRMRFFNVKSLGRLILMCDFSVGGKDFSELSIFCQNIQRHLN